MAKFSCPTCGKEMKKASHKRHMETVHGTAAPTASRPTSQPLMSGLRGEVGRIMDIYKHDPQRGILLRDHYIKGRIPQPKRVVDVYNNDGQLIGRQLE